jgi:prephenate dehydrogenase
VNFASLEAVEGLDRYEYLVVAVPLGVMGEVIERVVERRPRGIVVEVASIQGHLAAAIGRARATGVRVVALHPMFGPGREMAGEPLRFVLAAQEAGEEEAAVRRLLAGMPARLVTVSFDRHDALMAWVLGLAHLTSLLFARALAGCGVDAGELAAAASTTFARQSEVARALLGESPDLYLDIQRLNPHRREVYAAARAALDEVERLVEAGDREGFRALFAAARAALGEC